MHALHRLYFSSIDSSYRSLKPVKNTTFRITCVQMNALNEIARRIGCFNGAPFTCVLILPFYISEDPLLKGSELMVVKEFFALEKYYYSITTL